LSLSLSGGEADRSTAHLVGAPGPGAPGGQILSGIGSLASGLGIGVATGGAHGDLASLMAPTLDLAAFVALAVGVGTGRDGPSARKEKKRERKKEKDGADHSLVAIIAYAERDGVVGASIKALWSGRVVDLVKIRDELGSASLAPVFATPGVEDRRWLASIRRNSAFERRPPVPTGVASDGDADIQSSSYRRGIKGERRYDGRSTEEDSDLFAAAPSGRNTPHTFRGMLGGKMRGKLGNWAAYVVAFLCVLFSFFFLNFEKYFQTRTEETSKRRPRRYNAFQQG